MDGWMAWGWKGDEVVQFAEMVMWGCGDGIGRLRSKSFTTTTTTTPFHTLSTCIRGTHRSPKGRGRTPGGSPQAPGCCSASGRRKHRNLCMGMGVGVVGGTTHLPVCLWVDTHIPKDIRYTHAFTVDEHDGRLVRIARGACRLVLHRHVVHTVALFCVGVWFHVIPSVNFVGGSGWVNAFIRTVRYARASSCIRTCWCGREGASSVPNTPHDTHPTPKHTTHIPRPVAVPVRLPRQPRAPLLVLRQCGGRRLRLEATGARPGASGGRQRCVC